MRAMTDDGAFRVLTVRATDTVRAAVRAQGVEGPAAALFGDTLLGAVLVRETMAPAHRVQVVLRLGDRGQFVGDAHPEGRTRGLVRLDDGASDVALGAGGLLQVSRALPGRQPHQGVVEAGDDGGVAEALMRYFQRSEQVISMVALATLVADGEITAAGGFVVQLLPEVTEPPLAIMTERLRFFGQLAGHMADSDADPARLMDELLDGFAYTPLAESEVAFACSCDFDRALGAVSVLGRDEIRAMLDAGEVVSVACDYCRTDYAVGPEHFRALLAGGVDGGSGDR